MQKQLNLKLKYRRCLFAKLELADPSNGWLPMGFNIDARIRQDHVLRSFSRNTAESPYDQNRV
jgi:hypothetical protein